jgi:hypothetical protein
MWRPDPGAHGGDERPSGPGSKQEYGGHLSNRKRGSRMGEQGHEDWLPSGLFDDGRKRKRFGRGWDENVLLVGQKRILRTRTSPIAILLVEIRWFGLLVVRRPRV